MSYFDALYKRYLDEANAYAAKFGLDPTTASRDGHWDAFRHAYASAAMTKEYGRPAAHLFWRMKFAVTFSMTRRASPSTWTDGTMLSGVALRKALRIRTRSRVARMMLWEAAT
jgi:hypothetical protein